MGIPTGTEEKLIALLGFGVCQYGVRGERNGVLSGKVESLHTLILSCSGRAWLGRAAKEPSQSPKHKYSSWLLEDGEEKDAYPKTSYSTKVW